MMLVLNFVPLKLSLIIRHKFSIRFWWINIGFASYASYYLIFNNICGGSNSSHFCIIKTLSFLYLYHCSDNMVLAISVKQTTFEWSGSKKLNFDSAALTAFSSILHSKYLDLFLHFYVKLTHYKKVLFVHQVNCIFFSKFDLVALSVDCPAVCSVSVPFFVDIHFFAKK